PRPIPVLPVRLVEKSIGKRALERRRSLNDCPTLHLSSRPMCPQTPSQDRADLSLVDAYKIALETRNLEINLFWQRSNYFLVLNTAIAVGFFARGHRDKYSFMLGLL